MNLDIKMLEIYCEFLSESSEEINEINIESSQT